ncbi:hypothetical protein EKO27_g7883 [Xylaria grammica]|uniref:Uncharacterized protein n=1 Tax=Xylaria grammica TaxID=363999 RepID=A0A439CYD1_9PEZI|nr:hypothetical protein EKO27_g7883 [Xylaria grammica]
MSSGIPTYYPEGWDRERLLNIAVTNDINSVTEDQWAAFREGLRADEGERGFEEFFDEMWRREKIAKGIKDPVSEPPFTELMRLREERIGSSARWDPWGFVVFKSPEIRDQAKWRACRERFDTILQDYTDQYREWPGADECLSRMKFRWIEDAGDADGSIKSIAKARAALELPPGLDHSLSLYITPASLDSILNSPLPSSAKRKWRKDIPFIVAVSGQAAEEPNAQDIEDDVAGAGWRGYFNVAVESLLDSFFSTIAGDSRSPFELGGHVSGEDVYCDHTRWGIHKAGVGYWDRRAR